MLLQNLFKDMKRKLPTFQTIWCSSISQPCHRLLILMVLQNIINQPTLSPSLHYWMLNLYGNTTKDISQPDNTKNMLNWSEKLECLSNFEPWYLTWLFWIFWLRLANKCKFWKIRTNSGQFRQSWLILILLVLEFFWLIFGVDGFGNWRICPKPVPWHPDIFILAASNTI